MITHHDLTMLSAARVPFDHPEWVFELKYDGIRALVFGGANARIVSRNGNRLDPAFPELYEEIVRLPDCVLDAELVVLDGEGRPQFGEIQRRRLTTRFVRHAAARTPAALMAFDVLAIGADLRREPLVERRARLEELLSDQTRCRPVSYVAGTGVALYAEVDRLRLEGIVAKRRDAPYLAGRSRNWVKVKTEHGRAVERERMRHLRAA